MAQHYQIQHIALSIDDPRRLLGAAADKLLGMFRQPAGPHELAPGRVRLEVHDEPSRAVHREALPQVWQGACDGLSFAVSRRGARRRIETAKHAVIDFDVDRGWAHVSLSPGDEESVKRFLLLRLVCDFLTRGGHSFVHAACLAVPRAGQWQGVILSAPSNTGKTTTALALAHSGWRLLSDDITYVRPPHQQSLVWGFPRHLHVRPGTLAMLPWLQSCELGEPAGEGQRTLPLANLGDSGWVNAPWLTPALVAVLEKPNRRATRVEPIDRAQTLSCVGGESINAVPEPFNDDAARDFVTLGRLVCAAPACRVSVGPDPGDVAAKLEEFIEAHALAPSRGNGMRGRRAA